MRELQAPKHNETPVLTASYTVQMVVAFLVDLAIGDPQRLPHPVRMIGRLILFLEARLRKVFISANELRLAGIILVLTVTGATYTAGLIFTNLITAPFQSILLFQGISLQDLLIGLAGSFTLALKDLVGSVERIILLLRRKDLAGARQSLSRIVGRDTEGLDRQGVLRAALESLAENASDGVIAPLFYFALGGLPLALAYKAVNTLDSMVGYRNGRYLHFGWAGARLDDVANYLPARFTAFLLALAGAVLGLPRVKEGFITVLRDAHKHPSPNAGYPEAAMAGVLGVSLGGPSTYGGVASRKPVLGSGGKTISPKDVKDGILLVITASLWALLYFAFLSSVVCSLIF